MTIKYEKQYQYSAVAFDGYDCGIGILNPTEHNYEDLFADMYVKVVDFIGKKTSRICTCKLHSTCKSAISNGAEKLFFRHNNRRYYLDDFERVPF